MAHYPASRSSLSFACSILALLTKDCMNRVISSLSMRGMLPKYNFQPRPNSRALTTAGSVMTIRFINNRMLALEKKTVWREKTSLTSPEDWATATSRASSSPPHTRRQKEARIDRRVVAHLLQPTVWPVPYACARAVAAMDSCFALIGAHQHGILVGPIYGWSKPCSVVCTVASCNWPSLSFICHFEVALETDSVSCVELHHGIVLTQFPP